MWAPEISVAGSTSVARASMLKDKGVTASVTMTGLVLRVFPMSSGLYEKSVDGEWPYSLRQDKKSPNWLP